MDADFELAAEPQAIARRLIAQREEFGHLAAARIGWVSSVHDLFLGGDQKAAIICVATNVVRGPLRHLIHWLLTEFVADLYDGDEADFLVLVDVRYWAACDLARRERLVYHELCHVVPKETRDGAPIFGDDGRQILRLRGHDAEFFHPEVETYGVEICGLEDAAAAIAEGDALDRRRRLKRA